MRRTLHAPGIASLVVAAAVGASGMAGAACDVPLAIQRTSGEALVLIVFDNSGSMNEAMLHAAYDPGTTYSGNFSTSSTYNVSTAGSYTPQSFNGAWPTTPSAYLVNSDQGENGRYTGNYLNWVYFHATATERAEIPTVTRVQVGKQVVSAVLAGGTNSQYGLMVFNGGNGGTLLAPIGTSVSALQSQVNAIDANAYTPLAETMVDALEYFKRTSSGAPIAASCQKSFVVLVTDGLPTYDLNVPSYLQDYDGDGQDPGNCTSIGAPYSNSLDCSGYLDDVAMYMFENDVRPDLDGVQNVTSFVVGFGINAPLLQAAATKGGGGFFTATDAAELTTALNDAFAIIEAKVSAGASVSVVSSEDRTTNRLFRARFESVSWRGFVEAFALPFQPGDTPLWEAGALLESRDPDTRKIFTTTNGTDLVEVVNGNAAQLVSPLGAADVTEAGQIIHYTRGNAVTGSRDRDGWKLGDIVDSSPTPVGRPTSFHTFNSYPSFRSAHAGRNEVIYVGANDGMLHCFDSDNGAELWGYVPQNQMPKLKDLMSPGYCHEYFVNMSPAVYDIYSGGSWKTVLIGGQERGGSGLFALDVTDPAANQVDVLWDVNLPALKGSWNRPTLVRDKTRNGHVLVAGTGLDSLSGQARLLVLDPSDGSVITTHTLGVPEGVNMVTRATAFDKDFDGFDDLLYAGDLAGDVWRVDLRTDPWTVAKLFDNNQPIQATPVLTMNEQGHVMVFFGTGRYLTTPDLTTTSTQTFYGIFDNHSGTTISRSDLVNQTSSFNPVSTGARGWFMDLTQYAGERVIRNAALIAGALYFPSFRPLTGACKSGGESWYYSLDFEDGSAPDHRNGTENNTTTGRVQSMGDGILSNPAVDIMNEDIILQSSNSTMVRRDIDVTLNRLLVRSWRQKLN